ncbi:MAG: DUF4388 domain-containing protein [Actinomycetota bacterium]
MSLSGQLEIFPLEEVLRLLARSRQEGCLRVDGPGAGRIYMDAGSLTYATAEGDDAIREHLLASGLATEDGLRQVDVSHGSLGEALSPSSAVSALAELIREQCVEAVYRIRRPGTGHFEFLVDARPRYATGQAFDVETIIAESERRASEWADIESVVPDLGHPWRMVPEIDEDSVNLSDTAWRFLAAMDGSCSVEKLASRLGLTTFQTARRMAELSRAHLVEPAPSPAEAAPPAFTHFPEETAGEAAYQEPVFEEPAPQATEHDRSWWLEDEQERGAREETAASEPVPTPEEEPAGPEGEERDESFLETVFGELEKTEQPEPEEGEDDDTGFGLLRRRGLGAAFRELADS